MGGTPGQFMMKW